MSDKEAGVAFIERGFGLPRFVSGCRTANVSLEGTLRCDDRKDGLEGLAACGHDPTFPHDGIVERDES